MSTQRLILGIAALIAVCLLSIPAQAQTENKTGTSVLAGFITHVWRTNPTLQEAEARVAAAQARRKAAGRWQHNPELEFEVEDVEGEELTKVAGVSQTIDWSGKFLSAGKTAELERKAVVMERKALLQEVTAEVLSTLAEYRTTYAVAALARERTELMQRFARIEEKRFKAGDIDQGEYNLARLSLSKALIAQAEAETAVAESRQMLNTAVGFPLNESFDLPQLPEELPAPVAASDGIDDAVAALPALRAVKYREDAARAAVSQARKNRLPDPTVGIRGGQDAGAGMVAVSVAVPLYVINSFGAEVDAAQQDVIAQEMAYLNAHHAARMWLRAARENYRLSRQAWQNWADTGVQALDEQIDILDRKFEIGELGATDYLVSIEQALDTRAAAEQLHGKTWKSWFAWLAASGTVEDWVQNMGEEQ